MVHSLLRLLREPLLHFFALGAGIFLLFGLIGDSDEDQRYEVIVKAGQIDRLVEGWKKTRMRAPTVFELEGLIAEHIREEIYYREALAMGLESNDMIIRRRLRQKMEFLSQDLTVQADPTEAELQTYLLENASAFRIEPRITFRHIYLSVDKRGDGTHGDALRLLEELRGGDGAIDTATLGDPLPLPRDYASLPAPEVRSFFGRDFAARLLTLERGTWQGPVASGYGLHLVFVRERTEARMPELAQVRDAVEREWREVRRRATIEALYRRVREQYTVVVERPRWLDADADLAVAGQR
jgi:hypothetical protein